jgi:ABC-2 type transport system ATP-binding protein
MAPLLEVIDLHKQFGSVKAVDGISFAIPAGICFGLLGPNGAGKTTTIEMMEGISKPTRGKILYKGQAKDKRFAQQTGIQFQNTALPDYINTLEVLRLFSSFYKTTIPIDRLIKQCELGDFINREANKLSGGQKQRLLLALALINDPELIFLDEPTTGLDPQSRRSFWHLINDIKARGKTVVLTTHYMDEAETLCDQLVIMDYGKLIAAGSPQALLDQHLPLKRVCLQKDCVRINPQLISSEIEEHKDELQILTDSIEHTVQELMSQSVDLSTLRVRSPTLEDLFIKLTGHKLRD